jgi:phenylpropionate dioxygenase-like ring-hydroxylating dioxygenase large terminal subunit
MFLGLKQDFKSDHVVPLPQLDNLWSVVNRHDDYYLLSNVCPHQRSRINQCQSDKLQCPYHGLKFDLAGAGIDNNFYLIKTPCYSDGAMLFNQPTDYQFPVATEHFDLVEHRRDIVNAETNIIMDVFLDIEHIPVAHEGVYDKVGITNINNLTYTTFNRGSVQFVPAQSNEHMVEQDKELGLGACWMALYPGTMIEWQPGALFVTVATSKGVEVYKYRDRRYPGHSWKLNEEVWELAWAQDKVLSENIVTLCYDNLDALKQHHREWIQHAM